MRCRKNALVIIRAPISYFGLHRSHLAPNPFLYVKAKLHDSVTSTECVEGSEIVKHGKD